MRLFYYVHTGHRIGLDRFRRAAAIINSLGEEVDITLLCSDFRIAQIAKDFGVKNSVGIDVVRNIPQIANYGDKLIFDSQEANPIMLEDMKNYFSTFIHINTNDIMIDKKYFKKTSKHIKIAFFYGDDDYGKDLQQHIANLKRLNAELLLGFYYFLDYEDILKKEFPKHYEYEDYDEVITGSEILITASPQAVLECAASGGKPIYLQREDYPTDFNNLFQEMNIPVIKTLDIYQESPQLEALQSDNYYKLLHESEKISEFIKENLTL